MKMSSEDLDKIFSEGEIVSTYKFIDYGIESYDLTFEGARDLLYGALEDGLVRLTPSYRVERVVADV